MKTIYAGTHTYPPIALETPLPDGHLVTPSWLEANLQHPESLDGGRDRWIRHGGPWPRDRPSDKATAYPQASGRRDRELIVYCSIGERSSHTWFVMNQILGFNKVRNDDENWTEWANRIGSPIAIVPASSMPIAQEPTPPMPTSRSRTPRHRPRGPQFPVLRTTRGIEGTQPPP